MISTRLRVALLHADPSQGELLCHCLTLAGHLCRWHEHASTLVTAVRQGNLDLLVLDWAFPDINGVDLLKYVRGSLQSCVPVVFIGDRASETDIVNALTHGADDWIVKPVRHLELLARLEAITRRSEWRPPPPNMINLGALRFDCQSRTAWRDGRPIRLTAKDFDLSVLLLLHVGRLLSRAEIIASVWGPRAAMSSRTLDTHICRIRHKLELTPSNGWRLAAVYGHGYRLYRSG